MPEIFQRGRIWYMRSYDRLTKKRPTKSLGTKDKSVAIQRMAEELRSRDDGQAGLTIRGVTWGTFRQKFLAEYSGSTLIKYENAFAYWERIARPAVLQELTYLDAKNFKGALIGLTSKTKNSPFAPGYINTILRCLHTAFQEAVTMGYMKRNIFEDVKQIPETKRVPRYMTLEEARHFKDFTAKAGHPDIHLMTLFLLHTGIRKQELLNLRWTAIDMRREVMYLHGAEGWEPKDREEHAIGLHPDIVAELRKRDHGKGLMFPGRHGGVRDKDAVGRLFNGYLRRAGIAYTGVHINRHTFATHFQGPEKVLQRVLGHSDPRTTQRYRHVTPEELLAVRNTNYGSAGKEG